MYLNSIQIIGFIGKNPERRQLPNNGAGYTVFSVATQRSWKDAAGEWQNQTEWHRVIAWNSLGERAAETLHSGDHVFVNGSVVSRAYDRLHGDKHAPVTVKQTFWQIRASAIRKMSRADAPASVPAPHSPASQDADDVPF